MQASPTPPVTAGTVVEEVGGGWARWARTVVAASASLTVLAAGAVLWEYGRRAGTDLPVDPHDLATPHRRIALDVNAPGPLGAVR